MSKPDSDWPGLMIRAREAIERRKARTAKPGDSDLLNETENRARAWRSFVGGMGRRYLKASLDNFETYHDAQGPVLAKLRAFAAQFPGAIDEGRSVILFGPSGTGKDHLAAGLVRVAVLDHGKSAVAVDGVELWERMRAAMKSDTESARVAELIRADVLLLSDPVPQSGDLTSHQSNTLRRIVHGRYAACRPTFVTLNVKDGAQAQELMGVAVVDRLKQDGIAIRCNWPSYRKLAD